MLNCLEPYSYSVYSLRITEFVCQQHSCPHKASMTVLWCTDCYRLLCDGENVCLYPVITDKEQEKTRAVQTPSSFYLFPWRSVSETLLSPFLYRLSLPNMEKLKKNIVEMVKNCNNPKVQLFQSQDIFVDLHLDTKSHAVIWDVFYMLQYRILLRGCWYELFGGDPGDFSSEMDNIREEQLDQPLLGEESQMIHNHSSYQSIGSNNSLATYLPHFLPGRVVYITEDRMSRRFVCSPLVNSNSQGTRANG